MKMYPCGVRQGYEEHPFLYAKFINMSAHTRDFESDSLPQMQY